MNRISINQFYSSFIANSNLNGKIYYYVKNQYKTTFYGIKIPGFYR
jgi:hypothetical protein